MENKVFIISSDFYKEVERELKAAYPFGSVEIIISNGKITQISHRKISKTDYDTKEIDYKNTLETDVSGHIIKRNKPLRP